MKSEFELLDITELSAEDPEELEGREDVVARRARLEATRPKTSRLEARRRAVKYQAAPNLKVAINTALALEMPLLVAGEPGTGKTQVAWFIAAAFGLGDPLVLPVKSTTAARELLYDFDAVGDFRDGQEEGRRGLNRARHVVPGPLWRALVADGPRVLLIDEVDKAPRDFPNDLLDVLDRFEFPVPELERVGVDAVRSQFGDQLKERDGQWWVVGRTHRRRPIVVLTTNSERRLPEPFLRRCIFHVIGFTRELVKRIVAAHRPAAPDGTDPDAVNAPALPQAEQQDAIDAFIRLREMSLRKKPSTAELLGWLQVLAVNPQAWPDLKNTPAQLPFLSVLIKNQEDLRALRVGGR